MKRLLSFAASTVLSLACGGKVTTDTTTAPGEPLPRGSADDPSALPSERAPVASTDPSDVWLAFATSGRAGDQSIYVMRADGSQLRKLDLGGAAGSPAFSANGKALAYAAPGGIWVRDLTTGQSRQITHGADAIPAWSPDGKRIAFTRDVDIWIAAADGADTRSFVKGPPPGQAWYSNYGHPVFTRDGASLIFDRRGGIEIGAVDGSEHHLLVPDVDGGISMATVSPDGTRLAIAGGCGLRVVRLDAAGDACKSGASLAFVSSPARPSWSANGLIAYAQRHVIDVVSADGGVPKTIVDTRQSLGGGDVGELSWSPPGTVIR